MTEYIDDDRDMPRFRVNRKAMIDPDVLSLERERIFDHVWLYVGHETELPKKNDFRTREVAGRPVIFFRDSQGKVRVWINSCPHRGAMICREKEGNTRFMTCFYHGWAFSNAGKMVSLPGDKSYGENFERPGLASPARVDSYRGFVFVSFDPDVEDLESYLAGAREYLDLVCDQSPSGMQVIGGSHEYSVKANWKLLVENSFDGYHAVTAHQRYFEMVMAANPAFDASAMGIMYATELGNGHAALIGTRAGRELWGRPLSEQARAERNARFDGLREAHGDAWIDRMEGTRNLVIFPNLVIIDLVMGVVVRKIDPVTPDYMTVTAWELVPPEEGAELKRQRLDNFLTFWGPGGLASPDDVEALEMCQRGFKSHTELGWSDISRGMSSVERPPNGNEELQMRTWWRRWNQLVTGRQPVPEPHFPLPEELTASRSQPDFAPAS